MQFRTVLTSVCGIALLLSFATTSMAQSVCLPAPRLQTTLPMGGQIGQTFEVKITGDHIDDDVELLFSDAHITAVPKKTEAGEVVPNTFLATIAKDAVPGVCDARLMTRLGVSAARAFSINLLPEVVREKPNTSLETALALTPNCICNAYTTSKAIDYYTFESRKDARTVVECAAIGIDSKLSPVLIIADAKGRDLAVDRHGGLLDFKAPADGIYVVKVHELTFQGGPEFFYRLALTNLSPSAPLPLQPATLAVRSISVPPVDATRIPVTEEVEPNHKNGTVQKVTLPFEVSGKFFPAADVDTFEFEAKKGEAWWVEIASERMGVATNPFLVVQRVTKEGDHEQLVDVAEFNDIASPVKLSTNGYSYNGVFYDTGSADAMGKFEIKEDGTYRLHARDLFGGTTSDPRHRYRLIVRPATPDFSLAFWAMHMNLRNGDRNVLSKPIALRNGGAMAFDVVAIRKDGFDEPIDVIVENLPAGVTAGALTIPKGKNSGTLIISAAVDAPRALTIARITGQATLNGTVEKRPCHLASVAWATRNANQEVPNPRLMFDIPVSVSGNEEAPLTIAPAEDKVFLALPGDKLTIPLKLTWRGEFSGALKLSVYGEGFTATPAIDVPLNSATLEPVIDLAALKTPPGEYSIAFYGGVVSNYRYNVAAVTAAEAAVKAADAELARLKSTSQQAAETAKTATGDQKQTAEAAAKAVGAELKRAEKEKATADRTLTQATRAAAPNDIVDIVVSAPIRIRVQPAAK